MRMILTISVLLLTACDVLSEPAEHKLWPQGLPAGSVTVSPDRVAQLQAKNTAERIAYVGEPTITIHRAAEPNGCGVVIFPGGGYNILAYPKEGTEIAEWFTSIGVTAGVVKYRVPRRDGKLPHVEPVQDGQRAIRWMRAHADELAVDPKRIGALGFSAGGHLTAMTGMHWEQPLYESRDDMDKQSCRPDFMCPIYCAYLGHQYRDTEPQLGPLINVTKQTPPTFMSVTADDAMRGAHAALFFVELKKAGVPAELHIFAQGGHGYGMRGDAPAAKWNVMLRDWMAAQGFLNK